MRDEFSKAVQRGLAHRVGFKCSNPSCRKPTSGPSDEGDDKHINIGVAAHICAASERGPRYDSSMSSQKRSSVANGIWLCQTCAKMIDSDTARYTMELLLEWKKTAEGSACAEISCNTNHNHKAAKQTETEVLLATDDEDIVIITNTHPLQPSDFFRGRDAKLEEVKKRLTGDTKLMLLNGMGGIGKTEFCRKLFRECINKRLPEVKKVGWLVFHESIEQTFFQQFTELNFQTDSPSEYLVQAIKYLDNQKGNLLLFIDNANELSERDAALLAQLLCKVALTSRRRSIERLQPIEIGKLDIKDCRVLYRQHSEEYPFNENYNYGVTYEENDSPDEDLDAIIKMADRHTLAIELLAKTQKSAAYTTHKMRETLTKTGFSLTAIPESITYVHTPEAGEWDKAEQIFIEQFSKVLDISDIKKEKLRVLQLFSLLSADNITAENVRKWFEIDDLDMVNALVSQGWVFRGRSDKMQDVEFSMHPLISSVVRHKALPSFETAAPLAIGLSEALDFDDTDLYTDKLQHLGHAISLVEEINEGYDEYFALVNCVVVMLNQMAEYGQSLKLLDKAKELCDSVEDVDPLVRSTVYHNLASCYLRLSKYEQSKEWCQKAIALRENNPDTEKSQLANSYDCLGNIFEMIGEYKHRTILKWL